MKKIYGLLLLFIATASFAQTVTLNKDSVFTEMSNEVCGCSTVAVLFTSASSALDSCYKVAIAKHNADLVELGIDTSTNAGNDAIDNEVLLKRIPQRCKVFYTKLMKEVQENNATKSIFKGSLISQKQLPAGNYEVVIENNSSKERKTFISGSSLTNEVENFQPGYEITVEYMSINNPQTQKEELIIKKTSAVGSLKAGKH